ncbi:hypothetical protein [Leptospira yasudae]|uniref:Lipoprotein n=1 Tax=Leptospira yasudae TaxID=2202201 RepID=A0ABX9M516_9LEPT|nr:hypothetical protein [Leptospira yasudae]RHX80819.1 hypothetical protein DLM77_08050 [Leptospira yasudae]
MNKISRIFLFGMLYRVFVAFALSSCFIAVPTKLPAGSPFQELVLYENFDLQIRYRWYDGTITSKCLPIDCETGHTMIGSCMIEFTSASPDSECKPGARLPLEVFDLNSSKELPEGYDGLSIRYFNGSEDAYLHFIFPTKKLARGHYVIVKEKG